VRIVYTQISPGNIWTTLYFLLWSQVLSQSLFSLLNADPDLERFEVSVVVLLKVQVFCYVTHWQVKNSFKA
jgi:hypothetical protein